MDIPLLSIQNLHVEYRTDQGAIYAVNGLDMTLNAGETLGLVGETGAGKTTAALSVLRLLPDRIGLITDGQITLDGMDILNLTKSDMRLIRGSTVSMIFQDPMTSLNPTITVGDQISEIIMLHDRSLSKTELSSRVDEMLETVGIPASRKTDFPHQFSGGMKQRIVIAIALACEPKLLIADEPTTALDVTVQAQVLAMINELKEKFNTSIIMITHDLGVVAEVCDNIAIMYAGEIIESGTAKDIFESATRHPYTDGLFASIPDLTRKTKRLSPIEGLMPDPARLPEGCKFHERCPKRMDLCETSVPDAVQIGTHMIRCHLLNAQKEIE
ncbi:MAG: ABC transporter ATP-binding protein [Anaerovoracaceae bacterium]|jgi:peptide/nickel transport system ATP-binding protein